MSGIIVFDKPKNMTSHDAVDLVRKLSGTRKVGHAGTLDPMATGVLPICVGGYRRLIEYFNADRKIYEAEMKFGVATDTKDIWGETVEEAVPEDLTEINLDEIISASKKFIGRITQIAPAFSAVKHKGKKLYEYARRGEEAPIKKREVEIEKIEVKSYDPESKTARLEVTCGGGTYVRTLLEDIGREMGVPACMSALRRTLSNGFAAGEAHSAEELKEHAEKDGNIDGLMTGVEKAIKGAKIIRLGEAEARIFMNGQKINAMGEAAENDIALVYAAGELIGAGKFHDGILSPCKVIKEDR